MLTIVEITATHNRKSFNCGKTALNDFLLKRGLSPYLRTYVVVPERTSAEIIAFFTLSPDPTEIIRGDYNTGGLLTRLVKLEYLAVDTNYQRQGIGEDLLIYIMEQVVQAAEDYAIDALVLTPLDREAEQWYLKRDFGFTVTYIPDRALILSVETMRTVLAKAYDE